MSSGVILEQLASARRVADYADRLGVRRSSIAGRLTSDHMGAVLADAVLQAGVSYKTVVRSRIERIQTQFPHAARLRGVIDIIEGGEVCDFLQWQHPTKIDRFVSLAYFVKARGIETPKELNCWLNRAEARLALLTVNGVGPKTYDYLSCLVGVDCVAVDRHVRTFADEAGVVTSGYDDLKSVISYAADLLGMARRDFDAWIWRTISLRSKNVEQPTLI